MNTPARIRPDAPVASTLASRYRAVRARTLELIEPLTVEDTVAQSMPCTSPAKWHIAHVTWFFERFVLARDPAWQPRDPEWRFLFNSYYNLAGPQFNRPDRGLLTRPTLAQIRDFRARIDAAVLALLEREHAPEVDALIELGINHEQQHQELLLTDIKHLFSRNPLEPAYQAAPARPAASPQPLAWIPGREGLVDIGAGPSGFAYDNERPRHRALLHPHALASRLVTNGEYRDFIEQGGYRTPTLWLSEGWARVQREGWRRPLYWSEDLTSEFTLGGRRELDPATPASHLSFYEADAYARWAGARLPREEEWEALAAATAEPGGHFQDDDDFHPRPAAPGPGARQLRGDLWEWTSSAYLAYPGFQPLPGAPGEYNAKFMADQWVLRGGSCATPANHFRITYRNFFYSPDRWQFTGLRLARDT